MSQRQQLERIFKIDRQIRAGLYPHPEQLAAELEVSRRVIFDDRRFMIDRLGAPIDFERTHGGWYYTEPNWMLPTALITEGELLALFLSVELAGRHLGTAFEAPLKSAIAKIANSLRGSVTIDLERLRQHYTFASPATVATDAPTLLALRQAIEAHRPLRMRYYTASRRERGDRIVYPYHLHNVGGDWYLIAFDSGKAKMLTFNVGRIEAWRVLNEHFLRTPDFDPEVWLQSAFQAESTEQPVEIAVRFDAEEAVYIRERHWHDTQQIEELADGGLILRFTSSGLGAVKRFVLQYGRHAEVLAPDFLRAEIAEDVRRMKEIYQ
ncbi:MAG: WYL domain-containing protein [Armatimonadota bacterium]|nr:WYL domain-containing protein [Armatimonadota bacterium]